MLPKRNRPTAIAPRSLVAPTSTAELASAKRNIRRLITIIAEANVTIASLRGENAALKAQVEQLKQNNQ